MNSPDQTPTLPQYEPPVPQGIPVADKKQSSLFMKVFKINKAPRKMGKARRTGKKPKFY